MEFVSLIGLNKGDVLAAMFNAAKIHDPKKQGSRQKKMGRREASELLDKTSYIGSLEGRSLKIDFSGTKFDSSYYDRDNGRGLAQEVIDELRNWS